MHLEVDIGNTRLKWRLLGPDKGVLKSGAGFLSGLSVVTLDDLFLDLDLPSITHIGVASVVPSFHPILCEWCEQKGVPVPVFVNVARQCAGVINGYEDISQMGVDRWLAILAAYQVSPCAVVVSAGSAVTVDMVRQDGVHLGGYIVPGLRLMAEGLQAKTDRVKVVDSVFGESGASNNGIAWSLRPGRSTVQAVMHGLPLMLIGLIKQACATLASEGGVSPAVLLTGGDGECLFLLLEKEKGMDMQYVPSLIFDGLQLALEAHGGGE